MVGFVIVSHSAKLAEGVVDLARMMAKEVPIAAAGGLESMEDKKLHMADCPIVEGAVSGTLSAEAGSTLEEILDELAETGTMKKLS